MWFNWVVTIDVMDVSSDNQVDIEHDIFKVRLDKDGRNITEVPLKLGQFILIVCTDDWLMFVRIVEDWWLP